MLLMKINKFQYFVHKYISDRSRNFSSADGLFLQNLHMQKYLVLCFAKKLWYDVCEERQGRKYMNR